jgi:hypothetical protein
MWIGETGAGYGPAGCWAEEQHFVVVVDVILFYIDDHLCSSECLKVVGIWVGVSGMRRIF